MRLTRGLRGGGSLSLLSCSCSSTTGLSLPASTYSRAKGVCLFSFIVPKLDPATYAWLLTKLGASSPLGSGLELRQSQGRRISRDAVVRWDTRGKKANDKARRRAASPRASLVNIDHTPQCWARIEPSFPWGVILHYLNYPRG
jgi:hypothetical protein